MTQPPSDYTGLVFGGYTLASYYHNGIPVAYPVDPSPSPYFTWLLTSINHASASKGTWDKTGFHSAPTEFLFLNESISDSIKVGTAPDPTVLKGPDHTVTLHNDLSRSDATYKITDWVWAKVSLPDPTSSVGVTAVEAVDARSVLYTVTRTGSTSAAIKISYSLSGLTSSDTAAPLTGIINIGTGAMTGQITVSVLSPYVGEGARSATLTILSADFSVAVTTSSANIVFPAGPPPLFTASGETVNFNNLNQNQRSAILAPADATRATLSDVSNSLGGSDIITLPTKATLDALNAASTDDKDIAGRLSLLQNTMFRTGSGNSTITASDLPAFIAGVDAGTYTGERGAKSVIGGGGGDVKVLFPGQQASYAIVYSLLDMIAAAPRLGLLVTSNDNSGSEKITPDVTIIFTDIKQGVRTLVSYNSQQVEQVAMIKFTFDVIKKTLDGIGMIPDPHQADTVKYLGMFNFMLSMFSKASNVSLVADPYKYMFVQGLLTIIDAEKIFLDEFMASWAPQALKTAVDNSLVQIRNFAGVQGVGIYDDVQAKLTPLVDKAGAAMGEFWQMLSGKTAVDYPDLDTFAPTDEPLQSPPLPEFTPDQIVLPDGILHLSSDPLIDPVYYAAFYNDVFRAGAAADLHYAQNGWKEGRNPSAWFDTNYYLAQNPDVKAAGIDPLLHFETVGWKEGRQPSLVFSDSAYLNKNPDVKAAGVDPLLHYSQNGQSEGRPVFLVGFDGNVGRADPLVDAAFFDKQLGASIIPAGVAGQAQAAELYDLTGWKARLNPDAWFDTNYYLTQNPDVKAAGIDPLTHFETVGWKEGRAPSLLFDDAKYLVANPDVKAAGVDPLLHFITNGQNEGRLSFLTGGTSSADPLVDPAYYDALLGATLIPTGTAASQQAAYAYDHGGWQAGLNPDAFFDTKYYLSHNPDVAAAHIDPLQHYEIVGWKEGRDPSAAFSTNKYLAAYSDVKAAGLDPLLHFVAHGLAEGRTAFNS